MGVRQRPEQRPPLPTIYAVTVSSITVNALVSSSIPEVLAGVGATAAAAGLLLGIGTLPGIVLAPVIGVLADRYGRRELLIPCLVLVGVAGGLGALAPNLEVLLVLRLLQGVGSAGLANLAVVVIGDFWEGPERTRLIGCNSAALTISLSVLPVVGGAITELVGWQALFLLYPVSLLTALRVAQTIPRSTPRDVSFRDQVREALPVLRTRQVRYAVAGGVVIFALIFGLLLTVLPVYLADGFGLSPSARGVVLALPALTQTAAALSIGWLDGRIARDRQLLCAAGLLVVACLVVATGDALPVLIAGVLMFGAGEGLTVPILQDLATSATTGRTRGTVVATFVGASRLGQTLGPAAAGAGLAAGAPAIFLGGAVLSLLLAPVLVVASRAS